MYQWNHPFYVLLYFQLLGLYNLPLKSNILHERLLIIWTWMHLMVLFTLTLGIVYNAKQIFFIVDTLNTTVDVIQVAAPFITHYIILLESLLTRSLRQKIVHRMNEFDRLFPHALILITRQVQHARYIGKFAGTQLLSIFVEIYIMSRISANKLWSRHWYVSIFVVIVCRSQHLLYVYHMDIIQCRLQMIINELRSVNVLSRLDDGEEGDGGSGGAMFNCGLYVRIKRTKIAFNRLWEMNQFIEMAYGWSIFANILSNFICLTVNLYWNYVSLLYIQSNAYWKESFMCSCSMIITFFMLFSSCDRCLKTVSLLNCVRND